MPNSGLISMAAKKGYETYMNKRRERKRK